MKDEAEEFGGVIRRLQALDNRLRRTADPKDRELIRERIVSAKDDANDAFRRIRMAARRGDRDAKEALDLFKTVVARLDE
jgi:hypothetical protein